MSENKKNKKKVIAERFGKYLILDHLVDGGMAKICRARFLGDHADKIVAIKMVQQQYCKDESFTSMFLDEVKVSFGLIHPNIAQTYDYGVQNGQLYTAMEYVDGKNLKQYLDKLKANKFIFPIEVCVYITSLICHGLHYAHTYRDKLTGKELKLIHRDISPHNIMLSYDGSVKVIDFGIAKAETNSDATQAGTIKGKLSYLAPEYLEGMELDPRYDEFAVGITLWEMLTSRKLFKAGNDLAVLKEIQACKIPPPSSINRNIPKELDQIVLKALSKDRNNRYEDLDKMNRALVKFLYTSYPDFNPSDLAKFAGQLFKEDIKKDHKLMIEFGKIDIKPFLKDLRNQTGEGSGGEIIPKAEVFDFGFEEQKTLTEIASKKKAPLNIKLKDKKKSKKVDSVRKREASPSMKSGAEKTVASDTEIGFEVDGKQRKARTSSNSKFGQFKKKVLKSNNDSLSRIVPKVAAIAAIVIGGYLGLSTLTMKDKTLQATKMAKDKVNYDKLKRIPSSENKGKLVFLNFKKFSHTVFLNGKKINLTLTGIVDVKLNKQYYLRVEKKDTEHFYFEFMLSNETKVVNVTIPKLPSVDYGYMITADPSCIEGTMRFELFGEKRVEYLPIRNRKGIPAPVGELQVTVELLGEGISRLKTITVKRENELIDLCEILFWD